MKAESHFHILYQLQSFRHFFNTELIICLLAAFFHSFPLFIDLQDPDPGDNRMRIRFRNTVCSVWIIVFHLLSVPVPLSSQLRKFGPF
jgi:hypothetical protein